MFTLGDKHEEHTKERQTLQYMRDLRRSSHQVDITQKFYSVNKHSFKRERESEDNFK